MRAKNPTPRLMSRSLTLELSRNVDCLPDNLRVWERQERIRREQFAKSPTTGFILNHSRALASILTVASIISFTALGNTPLSVLLALFALSSFLQSRRSLRASGLRRDYQARIEAWVTESGDEDLQLKLAENRLALEEIMRAAATRHFRPLDERFRRYEGEVNSVQFAIGIAPSVDEEIMIESIREALPGSRCVVARVRLRFEHELGNTVLVGVIDSSGPFAALDRWYYA